MKQVIQKIITPAAPLPIGPYSQAILVVPNLLFISGQIPIDTVTQEIVADIRQATNVVMVYLQAILKEAHMDFRHVVKTTIFLTDMKDFPLVNEVYGTYFTGIENLPARETVAVAGLPKGVRLEISMIALKS